MIHTDGKQTVANAEYQEGPASDYLTDSRRIIDIQREVEQLRDRVFELEVELSVERVQTRRLSERNAGLVGRLARVRDILSIWED